MTEPRTREKPATRADVPGSLRRVLCPLKIRFRADAALTDDLFNKLSAANGDLRLERTARGDLEVMAPAGSGASRRNFLLNYRLGHWAENEGRGLGIFFDSSAGFTLPNGAIRSPDASWVALARWDARAAEPREGFARLCPDFVAEVRSPTDRLGKLRSKLREYIAQGARLGWLIDPRGEMVEIYRQGRAVETLTRPASLSGEDVLPGLVLGLDGILGPPTGPGGIE